MSAVIFNNGMIIGGILCLIFSLGLLKLLSNKLGAYFFIISSLALIGVGLFPKTIFSLHYISSVVFFVFITLALLVLGITIKRNKIEKNLAIITIVFACVAFSSIFTLQFFKGIAIPETIVFLPAFVWCMIYGLKMTISNQFEKLL